MNEKLITYLKIITNLIMTILLILILFMVVPNLIGFFLPFVIGWIISLIANPMVQFLEKRVKILRKHGSAIFILLIILVIITLAVLLVVGIVREAQGLIKELPELKAQLTVTLQYLDKFTDTLPQSVQVIIDKAVAGISTSVTEYVNTIKLPKMSSAGDFVGQIADGILMIIISIMSAYFFTANKNEISEGLKSLFPESVLDYWKLIYNNFTKAFGGYFKAQFKIMMILTAIMFIGFEILRIRYSFLLAIGIAFLDFLPVFGTGAVLWPWAATEVISGDYVQAAGLIIIYLVTQLVRQILQPKMVGDSIGLNPLATLLFMFIGYKLYGVIGMIIAVPVGMVLVNFYRIGMFDRIIKGFKIIAHDLNEFRKF